jgi:threonine dehydrogenase-like Zn-dependent dehydrogenase
MRAVVLRDERLDVREIAAPVPGPGELLLRTLSTAICASDVHFMDHPEMGINDPTGRSLYDANRDIVLGHEFVGEVVGHGTGCTEQFPVGTRVTSIPIRLVNGGADGARIIGQHPEAQGSFGELVVIAEALAKSVDDGVSNDAAALTDAFAVGEFYVRSARMEPGEVPVVVGAGAIGLSAVAALASRGSSRSSCRTTSPNAANWLATASGRTSRSTRPKSHRSTCGASYAPSVGYGVRSSSSNASAPQG